METRLGNCYAASEALWFLLGGREAGWLVKRIPPEALGDLVDNENTSHWFLQHESGIILDATVQQFGGRIPDYSQSKGAAFFPTRSDRSLVLMDLITWRDAIDKVLDRA